MKSIKKLREERDYWFMRARGDTRSLRDTVIRAEQADKEYQEALKEKNHESNKVQKTSPT